MLSSFSCIALSMLLKKGIHSLLVSLSSLLHVLLCLNLDQGRTEQARTRSQPQSSLRRSHVLGATAVSRRQCGGGGVTLLTKRRRVCGSHLGKACHIYRKKGSKGGRVSGSSCFLVRILYFSLSLVFRILNSASFNGQISNGSCHPVFRAWKEARKAKGKGRGRKTK